MKREVKIGIFTVVIICCSWAGIRFLSGIDIFGRNTNYYACYDEINGISNASPVLLQGVKIGTVTDVILDPTTSDKVTLKLSIKRRFQIPENTTARIYSPGLMSSMAIGLSLGNSTTMLEQGDTIATKFEESLMDIATEKLMGLADNISAVSDELTTALGSINELLSQNSNDISGFIANLNYSSSELSSLLKSQKSNIEESVAGLSKFSTTLGDNAENLDKLLYNLGVLSSQLSEANLGESLSLTVANLNATFEKLNSSEGSAGKLLNDEQLYENLSAVSGSLDELISDMQANPKRYVHFSLFGSKDKSQE